MLRTQHNAWIHVLATACVIAVGAALRVSIDDWRWLVVAMALVWATEAINTALEYLCDVVQPDFHTSVKRAKDIAAAAVLVCAIAAVAIGLLTIWPYLARYSAALSAASSSASLSLGS